MDTSIHMILMTLSFSFGMAKVHMEVKGSLGSLVKKKNNNNK